MTDNGARIFPRALSRIAQCSTATIPQMLEWFYPRRYSVRLVFPSSVALLYNSSKCTPNEHRGGKYQMQLENSMKNHMVDTVHYSDDYWWLWRSCDRPGLKIWSVPRTHAACIQPEYINFLFSTETRWEEIETSATYPNGDDPGVSLTHTYKQDLWQPEAIHVLPKRRRRRRRRRRRNKLKTDADASSWQEYLTQIFIDTRWIE